MRSKAEARRDEAHRRLAVVQPRQQPGGRCRQAARPGAQGLIQQGISLFVAARHQNLERRDPCPDAPGGCACRQALQAGVAGTGAKLVRNSRRKVLRQAPKLQRLEVGSSQPAGAATEPFPARPGGRAAEGVELALKRCDALDLLDPSRPADQCDERDDRPADGSRQQDAIERVCVENQNVHLAPSVTVRCSNIGSSCAPPAPATTVRCGVTTTRANPKATHPSALVFLTAAASKIRLPITAPAARRTRGDASKLPRRRTEADRSSVASLRTMKPRACTSCPRTYHDTAGWIMWIVSLRKLR